MTLSTSIWVLILFSFPCHAWSQTTFTLGSTRDEVRRVQGTPTDINLYPALGYEIWRYGLSSVTISMRDLRVIKWDNSGNLKVVLKPGVNVTTVQQFTQGSHKDDVLRLQGTPTDINLYPALGYEVWRYGLSSVTISLATSRVVELSNSGQLNALSPKIVAQRAVKYHHSVGDIRLYYDEDKAFTGIFSMTDPELGDLYGVEQEGVVYFYDRSLQPVDLYVYPDDRGSLRAGTFRNSRSSAWLSDFSSRLTQIDVSGDVTASGTAMRFGKMTFYDLISTSGNAVHGTSLDFGTVAFDDFYSTTGVSLSGCRVQVGNFSFGDWWSSEGTSGGGTTQRIGNILFHDYRGADGTTYSGTTMEISNFSFTDITGR